VDVEMKEHPWTVAGEPTDKNVSKEAVVRDQVTLLAIQRRKDLSKCEEKIGTCPEFTQL
jgi:hypothetical protein